MNNNEKILAILKEVKPTKNMENVTDIIDGGYIDSFELMFLITKLDDEFGIEVSVDDITVENFNSVSAMAAMVETLLDK